jgi:hypothetical protein
MTDLLDLCDRAKEALEAIALHREFKAKWAEEMRSHADFQLGDAISAVDSLLSLVGKTDV